MDNVTLQSVLWMAAAGTLLLYVKRRRKRKLEQ